MCGAFTAIEAASPQAPTPTLRPAPAARSRIPWWTGLPLLAIVLFVLSGFFHFVRGEPVGCTVIRKESWGVKDTFVDLDEVGRRSILELIAEGRAPLLRALIREGIVNLPPAFENPDP